MKLLFSAVYKGPNRRGDRPFVEQLIEFDERQLRALESNRERFLASLTRKFQWLGLISSPGEFPPEPLPREPVEWLMSLFAQTGLLLQRSAGHDVNEFMTSTGPGRRQGRMLFEHEDSEVAVKVAELIPRLVFATPSDPKRAVGLRDSVYEYLRFASGRVLPEDTRVLVEEAENRGIPATKLDRDPYVKRECEGVDPGFRVRPNGRLMLGFGINRRIVDGTFAPAVSRDLLAHVGNQAASLDLVEELGVPVIRSPGGHAGACRVILANRKPVAAVLERPGEPRRILAPGQLHPEFLEYAERVAENVNAGVMGLSFAGADITGPPGANGGATGLDLAPELERLLDAGSDMHREALRGFLDWLYPAGTPSRIPIVAVTGTNGKTTTVRMINRVAVAAGYRTGLVCTEGIYLDGEQVHEGDMASRPGHLRVLESEKVDFAVLEAHHRGMRLRGQAFHRCDVAVCTNVTADHIEDHGLETVEQVAEIKRSLLERARDAVVLNADDDRCLAMLPHLDAKCTCLVSMQSGVDQLKAAAGGDACYCVLDAGDGEPRIVFWRDGTNTPVMPVGEIPATHGGTADFNVANAMHAIAAARLAGIGWEAIRTAMSGFGTDFETTPGRLNIHDGPLFRTVLDFAHNYEGHRKLAAWVEKQDVEGRKILLISVPGDRGDKEIIEVGTAPAGSYDHYVCRPFLNLRGRQPGEVAGLLKRGLLEAGVPEDRITVETDFEAALLNTLNMGRRGDLLVVCNPPSQRSKTWETIRSFVPEGDPTGAHDPRAG